MSSVTFTVADHPAVNTWFNEFEYSDIMEKKRVNGRLVSEKFRVIQESPGFSTASSGCGNSFIRTVIAAYSRHHNLVIRPDDVWFAIMAQFSAYMEKNSEALRSQFVTFEGQRQLTVKLDASLNSQVYGVFINRMAALIKESIREPSVYNWIIPSFSTTTDQDKMVFGVALMSSMKAYFTYKFQLCCGIPRVTLLGTREDWTDLQRRVRGLTIYDLDGKMKAWVEMLEPIIQNFINSYDSPDLDWWSKVCTYASQGSGSQLLSGWITAFMVFDDQGNWVGTPSHPKYHWPVIDMKDIPDGYVKCPVLIQDNNTGKEYKSVLYAGHIVTDLRDENKTMVPRLDWALVINDYEGESQDKPKDCLPRRNPIKEAINKLYETHRNESLNKEN